MSVHHPHALRRRAIGAYLGLGIIMSVLLVGFFRIQVLRGAEAQLRARDNRLRALPVPAPRGTIYDREGRTIADNIPGYQITVLPAHVDTVRRTLDRMGQYTDLSEERKERVLRTLAAFGREVVVDTDASFESVAAIEARQSEFPGVFVEMRPRRRYAAGAAAGHLTGYVGEINADELASEAFPDSLYEAGMLVGKIGIELEYESRLQGRPGLRYVEFDARNRLVGEFGGAVSTPALPGEDIHLNIDLPLQEWIASIFPDSMSGAVVALDPSDGGVLAMYSAPGFDPNLFTGGIDEATWALLNEDEQKPLYDRAVLGRYAPASTWKLASAGIGLDLGVITPEERMPEPCTGAYFFGDRFFRCHDAGGHGYNNLAEAIGNSCDVYFYQLGQRIGLSRLIDRSLEIGFNGQCGVDLPYETSGFFPYGPGWWTEVFGYRPREGEALVLSIGQGANSQTPLKMAQFYVALARDGSAPAPTIARDAPEAEGWELNLAPEHIESLREGLRFVTAPGGTAHIRTAVEHWDVIGKTGTGQNSLSVHGLAEDHAWFAGMAGPPGEPPEIVVVAIVEYGTSGGQVAAPIVAKAADFYLRQQYGIPQDTVQTYWDHIRTGPIPEWYRDRYLRGGRTTLSQDEAGAGGG